MVVVVCFFVCFQGKLWEIGVVLWCVFCGILCFTVCSIVCICVFLCLLVFLCVIADTMLNCVFVCAYVCCVIVYCVCLYLIDWPSSNKATPLLNLI